MKLYKTMFTTRTNPIDTLRRAQTFQQVVEQFHQPLYRYFAAHTNGDLHCAHEMTAETFSILYHKPVSSNKETFSSWLFGIAWDVLNAYYGCEGVRTFLSTIVSPISRSELNDPEIRKTLKALAGLTFYPRETLYLRLFAGLDVKDISILMDKSDAAIKATVYQGLAEFACQLDGHEYVAPARGQLRSLAHACHLYLQSVLTGNTPRNEIPADAVQAVERFLTLRELVSMKPDAYVSLVSRVEQLTSATRL